jgi:hypothetical protein
LEDKRLAESPESARLQSQEAPPEAVSAAREAVAATFGTPPRKPAPPDLSEKETQILRALTEALVPVIVRARTGGEGVDTVALLLDFMRGWRREYRLALRASLRFIEYAPIIFQIKPKNAKLGITPFTGLPVEDRERVCKRLDEAHSYHVRSLFKIAKVLVYGVYYSHVEVSRAIGYDAAKNKEAAEAWARSLGR